MEKLIMEHSGWEMTVRPETRVLAHAVEGSWSGPVRSSIRFEGG